jgi:hypothetical protein
LPTICCSDSISRDAIQTSLLRIGQTGPHVACRRYILFLVVRGSLECCYAEVADASRGARRRWRRTGPEPIGSGGEGIDPEREAMLVVLAILNAFSSWI